MSSIFLMEYWDLDYGMKVPHDYVICHTKERALQFLKDCPPRKWSSPGEAGCNIIELKQGDDGVFRDYVDVEEHLGEER